MKAGGPRSGRSPLIASYQAQRKAASNVIANPGTHFSWCRRFIAGKLTFDLHRVDSAPLLYGTNDRAPSWMSAKSLLL